MIKKNIWLWALPVAMLVTGSAILAFKKNHQQAAGNWLPVDVHVLKLSDGWGYEVLVDKKVFIHQDCIPAIPAFKRFSSEPEALLIGNKVVDKILQGQKPAITLAEINNAHIRY